MKEVLDTSHLSVEGDFLGLWKLKHPPNVKNFLWHLCRNCISARERLVQKGLQINDTCPWCNDDVQSLLHLFGRCSKARSCWMSFHLRNVIDGQLASADSFVAFFFQRHENCPS